MIEVQHGSAIVQGGVLGIVGQRGVEFERFHVAVFNEAWLEKG